MSERIIPIVYESEIPLNQNRIINNNSNTENDKQKLQVNNTNNFDMHNDNIKYEENENTTYKNDFQWIRFNFEYFKTLLGTLKLLQLILGIVCIILASNVHEHITYWFLGVIIFIFIATLIWIFVYFLSIHEAIRLPIDWILSELFNSLLSTILYIIVSFVQIIVSFFSIIHSAQILPFIVGLFGLLNSIVYMYATYLLYQQWKHINNF